jgi:hypothetical protein
LKIFRPLLSDIGSCSPVSPGDTLHTRKLTHRGYKRQNGNKNRIYVNAVDEVARTQHRITLPFFWV